ncbi:rhomboid family intramembrane serine protease [Ancylobacter sp. 6x-1]|uniref:Rhomboid family intramembrane serine protease n=1 Tax=Ancylobacter crimeensis TaxID=2579147 RepID=A0ABT0DF55_9HYPH|nr:rhomboid family intramembrane serine protease [Ancylobacter crimeensis]MCK0198578.1 rhomboid family intramembrane serine protease [Ancylobacter crimeensis]
MGAYVSLVLDTSSLHRPRRQPILNVPAVIAALGAAMLLIHGARALMGPELDAELLVRFAFIPARYEANFIGESIGADIWTFLTYAFLHANLTHIGVNVLWMLAFGSPVARRFGTVRFLVFFAVTAVAGAFAHLAGHWGEMLPMVGASAAISGCMAAAVRFIFSHPGFGLGPHGFEMAVRQPAPPLSLVLRDRRVIGFLAVWFFVNLAFGFGMPSGLGEGGTVAWEAHIGGFLAGLLLFPLFDPVPRMSDDFEDPFVSREPH